MNVELNSIIEQVSREQRIDKAALQEMLEQALLQAARRVFGAERRLETSFNEQTGNVDLIQVIRVVEQITDTANEITLEEAEEHGLPASLGEELLFQIHYLDEHKQLAKDQDERYGDILQLRTQRSQFGRIAAQTAKQVIIQRVREAERDNIYGQYINSKGTLMHGVVRRLDRGHIHVDIGGVDAILPTREQVSKESYRPGSRLQAYVLDVQRNAKGPQIVLSRSAPGLLIKLFEMEVPEIGEGIVRIEAAVREPGNRAKIAVSSQEPDVDPVGACVGMKGSRVQAVVQELQGEKIDIITYSENPATFVCNAIQPAEVSRVLIDDETFTMDLIVPDDQLSLAIGRRGQNVRLASQLTGWKLNIHSESRIRELENEAKEALMALDGVNPEHIDTLWRLGYRSLEHILQTGEEDLAAVPGISLSDAEFIKNGAKELLARKERGEDIRPRVPLPEGYDMEAEWARWPKQPEIPRSLFDRAVRVGLFTIDDLIAVENPENLARTLAIETDRAANLIFAAREARAASRQAAQSVREEHVSMASEHEAEP